MKKPILIGVIAVMSLVVLNVACSHFKDSSNDHNNVMMNSNSPMNVNRMDRNSVLMNSNNMLAK